MATEISQRSAKRVRLSANEAKGIFSETVTIVVGPQGNVFHVHEDLLRESSQFFDKAMGAGWKESQDRKITLPSDEPAIVALYVYWLYYGAIPMSPEVTFKSAKLDDLRHVKAWILVDKLIDTKFQNAVIHAILERVNTPTKNGTPINVSRGAVNYAFENTMKGASIRRLFVDSYCWNTERDVTSFWKTEEDIPHDFLVQAVKVLVKPPFLTAKLQASNYYVQNQEEKAKG
ncbi:uncharacterized protein N7496_000671 [Penicillium cataractarum]|uniref:BTB domain-containing protein n=1 Tax=Penicillium cataractarum TaxID=2100454 RepID=A0A9W9VUN0_9EURO|nr:uncharacterized protein N7496_000671 [Penicillium cataractarum]KAJ5389603.1 hypothetical protein N7496_000671 [Penicillium cataractarum]